AQRADLLGRPGHSERAVRGEVAGEPPGQGGDEPGVADRGGGEGVIGHGDARAPGATERLELCIDGALPAGEYVDDDVVAGQVVPERERGGGGERVAGGHDADVAVVEERLGAQRRGRGAP